MRERRAPRRAGRQGPAASGVTEATLTRLVAAQGRLIRRAAAAAHAVQEERLRRLEQDVADLRGRVNGLIFLVAGTVLTQVIMRLLG